MRRKVLRAIAAALLGAGLGGPALADEDELAPIIVTGRAENLIGIADAASEGRVGAADFDVRPLQRVGELLEVIPGLIATQHSGSGKANQYFLRGFNLDHGTDFAVFFDGVPMNFRTHGHGQGYLDLNPIIPEAVAVIDYRKGPYRADVGDFASVGTALFTTIDDLPEPFVLATIGTSDYYRFLAGGSGKVGSGTGLLMAELRFDQSPYVRPQELKHVNLFGKWTGPLGGGTLRAEFSGYHASWNSTDQVPLRAIESGLIPRLGFIDPDTGGETTRIGFAANWTDGEPQPWHVLAYAHYYDMKLFSNFTYLLDDPVNGDEFGQFDRRTVIGGRIDKALGFTAAGMPVEMLIGAETRLDFIPRVGLYRTAAREILSTVRQDNVKEYSGALFAEATLRPTDRLRILLGLRGDAYRFDVRSDNPLNSGVRSDSILSPKASLAWRPVDQAELYLNWGQGFHSNDARGTVIRVDPVTRDPALAVDPLVRSEGEEVGVRLRPLPGLSLTATYWRLRLASELLFIGDGGSTEPQGPSRRDGFELAMFWQPNDWLTLDAEYTDSRARFTDLPTGENCVPGAIETVFAGGIVVQKDGWTGTFRVRHFGPYALIEDNSRRSRATTVANAGLSYEWSRFEVVLDIFNLFDSQDNDITYFYASRLEGEPEEGVEDFHIHPVEPRQARVTATLRF